MSNLKGVENADMTEISCDTLSNVLSAPRYRKMSARVSVTPQTVYVSIHAFQCGNFNIFHDTSSHLRVLQEKSFYLIT